MTTAIVMQLHCKHCLSMMHQWEEKSCVVDVLYALPLHWLHTHILRASSACAVLTFKYTWDVWVHIYNMDGCKSFCMYLYVSAYKWLDVCACIIYAMWMWALGVSVCGRSVGVFACEWTVDSTCTVEGGMLCVTWRYNFKMTVENYSD